MDPDPKPLWDDDPRAAWAPYRPTPEEPWDAARVAHLHRRAGFGATAAQLRRDLAEGFEPALRRVLDGEDVGPDGRSAEAYRAVAGAMTESARRDPSIVRVRLAWLFRLLHGPHALAERMTLAWHGHYPTAHRKVQDPLAQLEQVEDLRRLWDAPISELHRAILRSSAMQVWLDGPESDRDRPNENLGREFLELFALGEGHYAEADVRAAARALTGFRRGSRDDLLSRPFVFDPKRHDPGPKTLLGKAGPWGLDDLVRIACRSPAAARHVARRLFVTFVDDIDPAPPDLVDALADVIRTEGDVDVRLGIETVLGSRIFHAEATRGRRARSPVEFVAGLARCAAWYRPGPDAAALDVHLTHMGQTLLDPPSVAGWPGGLAWLGAPLLIARANTIADLTDGLEVEDHFRAVASVAGCTSPAAWGEALGGGFLPTIDSTPEGEVGLASTFVEAIRIVAGRPEASLA